MQTPNCPSGDNQPQYSLRQSEAASSGDHPCRPETDIDSRLESKSSRTDVEQLSQRIFTIGHSNHEPARFVELLGWANVTVIADVRSSPYSQRQPQFNQPELRRTLETSGIRYVFFGDELGGRPRDIAVYDGEGRVDYWRVRRTAPFRAGLTRLLEESRRATVAMACAEEDPLDCHRGLMIAAALVEQGICPRHLRGNGTIETTPQLECRLFQITGIGGGMATGLFAASLPPSERAELLADAYKAQAQRKAFRLPPGQDPSAIDSLPDSFIE